MNLTWLLVVILTLSWRRSLSYRNQAIDLLYERVFLHERVNEKLSNPLDLVEHKCEQRKNVLAGSAWKFQSIWRSSGSGSYQSLPPLQFQSEAAENCYQICQKESTLYRVKREIIHICLPQESLFFTSKPLFMLQVLMVSL